MCYVRIGIELNYMKVPGDMCKEPISSIITNTNCVDKIVLRV